MSEIKLNLARKWRSRNFNEIVGQELSVRMLKNGLFLHQYFPVYLFSGQRGCGKTTTARVFAAALNCEALPEFQKNPQRISVPCLTCKSCLAMQEGKHPDFIEIDAASHTGVDNVRSIIDSASLMPLMGNKKIYLIDEAHMLSKAAFNAFLKIMEEPPASVLFILATTDSQKIIETVRSRCFQLFFKPVDAEVLKKRLQQVCTAERIAHDDAGLEAIIKQTEGSVRDALNVLEQVRFSSKEITHDAVMDVLGFIDDVTLIDLLERVLFHSPSSLLQFLQEKNIQDYSIAMIWVRMLALARAALWLKHGVTPFEFTQHHLLLVRLVKKCSAQQLHRVLQTMYDYQELFGKTTAKYELFEMVLLTICQNNGTNSEGGTSPAPMHAPVEAFVAKQKVEEDQDDEENEDDEEEDELDDEPDPLSTKWKNFIAQVEALNDPLVTSVFTQGMVKECTDQQIVVEFSRQFVFFQDWLDQTKHAWEPILKNVFGNLLLQALFTGPVPEAVVRVAQPIVVPPKQPAAKSQYQQQQPFSRNTFNRANVPFKPFASEQKIDISDEATWKKAHLLLRYIPGSITEITQKN